MAIVWIPSLLRDLTHGRENVTVPGATVRQIIDNLDAHYPGIKPRLCDDDGLRPGIAVAIDTQIAQGGLAQPVPENSEVHFVPAISGGSSYGAINSSALPTTAKAARGRAMRRTLARKAASRSLSERSCVTLWATVAVLLTLMAAPFSSR